MRIATLIVALISGLFPGSAFAEQDDQDDKEVSPTVIMAGQLGAVAGAARYCRLDPELVEEYMAKAEARIATASRDDVELVVARIEFNNRINLNSTRAPNGGCDQFADIFDDRLQKLS